MSAQPSAATAADPRRWKALAVLGLIQFMLILDVTVVNVALPHIQRDLGFSESGLSWVVNGYVLMAGGLLLLGGRLADVFGRRRLFLLGVALFAVASITCGAAADPAMLVFSRFLQGAGEALAAPASLGLIALLFPDPLERMKALGIWGGIAGLGGTSGTVISGFLTDLASWRWIFFINVPVALVALLVVPRLVAESRMTRDAQRPDYWGATTGTLGLIGVVYGIIQAAEHSWGSTRVLLPLLAGLGLLALMVRIESASEAPLIPLSFFRNRTRVVSNVTTLFFSSSFFTYFFLLTLFEQQVLGWTPIHGGLSYLPFGLSIGAGIGLGTGLMPRLGVKRVLAIGFFGCAGRALADQRHHGRDQLLVARHARHDRARLLLRRLSFPSFGNASLHEVTGQDSSLASGVQSAMQQIGGALGLATLATLALRHASHLIGSGIARPDALTDGYVLAFRVGALLCVVGGVLVFALMEQVVAAPRDALAGEVAAEAA